MTNNASYENKITFYKSSKLLYKYIHKIKSETQYFIEKQFRVNGIKPRLFTLPDFPADKYNASQL